MEHKPFDIILVGATGFTGKRAACYLKTHAPNELTWGVAARNSQKLHKLAQKLDLPEAATFIVDTLQPDQVKAVVEQTKIIITTAGPFSLYGEEVIAACAKYGTHYLDITGETEFIREMMDRHQTQALQSGATLIPFSGFDSVPADVAAFLLSRQFDTPDVLTIKSYYTISGGFNGGTIATMLNKFETGDYKNMNTPDVLLDGHQPKVQPPQDAHFFGYDKKVNRWSTPFIMGPINAKVVYKTAELMHHKDKPYAQTFSYSEHSRLGKWYNPFSYIGTTLILASLQRLGPEPWFRTFLKKIMPDPGEGPSEKTIEQGFFKLISLAEDANGNSAKLEMHYPGDPGNKSTVFFLCESALLLFELLKTGSPSPGFQTPIAAFGYKLPERLQEKGLNIVLT